MLPKPGRYQDGSSFTTIRHSISHRSYRGPYQPSDFLEHGPKSCLIGAPKGFVSLHASLAEVIEAFLEFNTEGEAMSSISYGSGRNRKENRPIITQTGKAGHSLGPCYLQKLVLMGNE